MTPPTIPWWRLFARRRAAKAALAALTARLEAMEERHQQFAAGIPSLLTECRTEYANTMQMSARALQAAAVVHNDLLDERFHREALEEIVIAPGTGRVGAVHRAYLRRLDTARGEGEKRRRQAVRQAATPEPPPVAAALEDGVAAPAVAATA
jgi:hypothetical protein